MCEFLTEAMKTDLNSMLHNKQVSSSTHERNTIYSSRGHPWRYRIQHQVEKGSPGELRRLCLAAWIDKVLEAVQGKSPLIY